MPIKKYKPTTPGRRDMSVVTYENLDRKARPEKRLVATKKSSAGRNNQGRITVRHRGGGNKKKYRFVDFSRVDKDGVTGTVDHVTYDPNRSSLIALVVYADGEKRYILAEENMKAGDTIMCKEKAKVKPGNRMQVKNIPEGFNIYNLEFEPGKGGQYVRGAGMSAKLVTMDDKHAQIKLPSGEIRLVLKECYATVGRVGNIDHSSVVIGKAGRNRWKGKRPTVRGKVMNPVDHPHGGGEGNQSIGMKSPKTPWGKVALGLKTRKRKYSNSMIVTNRKGYKLK